MYSIIFYIKAKNENRRIFESLPNLIICSPIITKSWARLGAISAVLRIFVCSNVYILPWSNSCARFVSKNSKYFRLWIFIRFYHTYLICHIPSMLVLLEQAWGSQNGWHVWSYSLFLLDVSALSINELKDSAWDPEKVKSEELSRYSSSMRKTQNPLHTCFLFKWYFRKYMDSFIVADSSSSVSDCVQSSP